VDLMADADEPQEQRPGGRLQGPEAGWDNMLRNLASDAAVADAEAYARGERRLTVHHYLRDDRELDELLDVVADAIGSIPQGTGSRFTSVGRSTRWYFSPPAAAEQLAAARAAVERINPGHWRIDADVH
jgi:hypothetical protein